MDVPVAMKTCRMCCTEIPQQARKCPHCHHFQNRWTLVMFHPAVAACFAGIPFLAAMIALYILLAPFGNFETYRNQIEVTESRIAFGELNSRPTVAVIGTIRNTSLISWKDVYLHVDFLDADGNLVDVGERVNYMYRVPAGETTSFKASFCREFPDTKYVTAVVRVVGATDARSRF